MTHGSSNTESHKSQNFKKSHSHRLTVDPYPSLKASAVSGASVLLNECFQMDDNGFILIHRKLRDHWIATDHKTLAVFHQILTRVEWKDDDKTVYFNQSQAKLKRGQMTCGRSQMCRWAGVTAQSYKTAITKLKSTNTITIQSNSRFSIITLVNWDKYQYPTNRSTSQPINDQQVINQKVTTLEQYNHIPLNKITRRAFSKPSIQDIKSILNTQEAEKFLDYYESNGWKVGRNPMKDWKATARNWARNSNQQTTKPKTTLKEACFICDKQVLVDELPAHRANCARKHREINA